MTRQSRNWFDDASVARRYRVARPRFYHRVTERIRARLAKDGKRRVHLALDVACGPGLFAVELARLADEVIAIDPAPAMLRHALRRKNIRYVRGPAERLPVDDDSIELISVGLAYHWFRQPAFLQEAYRALAPGGLLAVFSHACEFRMVGDGRLRRWADRSFSSAFPAVPRAGEFVTADAARRAKLALERMQRFRHAMEFDARSFVEYICTHSNVLAKIGSDPRKLAETRRRLRRELAPVFGRGKRAVWFTGTLQFLVKTSS